MLRRVVFVANHFRLRPSGYGGQAATLPLNGIKITRTDGKCQLDGKGVGSQKLSALRKSQLRLDPLHLIETERPSAYAPKSSNPSDNPITGTPSGAVTRNSSFHGCLSCATFTSSVFTPLRSVVLTIS